MAHLKPQYVSDAPFQVETNAGTEIVPSFLVKDETHISDYLQGTHIVAIETLALGIVWRLSAAGYMDCTEWNYSSDLASARKECEALYDVDPDTGDDNQD